MVEIQRLYVFLALFTFVYFLESIGGTYMITAVQNIERHFQIPSKLSGFLVSAHDISYVLLVIQVAFYGSKGNRAKWIGFGTIMMALAHIMTSSPNFFFPPIQPQLNLTDVEVQLRPNPELLALSAQNSSTPSIKQLRQFLAYPPLRDRLPIHIRETLEAVLNKSSLKHALFQAAVWPNQGNYTAKNEYSLDEPLISEILSCSDQFLSATESSEARENAKVALIAAMRRFVKNREEFPEADLKTMRRAAVAPFAFCHGLVNQLRGLLQDIKCHRSSSNLEPLIIIFGAMLVLGFGRTMPWSLGIPLIDDNVKRQEMPIYFAMINFFKILGPICGFVIGSFMNKLYYTFPGKAPKGLTYLDPTWIGAWWLGFLIIGIVMIGPSVALFFFPESSKKKRLQNSQPPQHQHLNGGGLHGHRQHQIVNGNCRVADFDSFPRSQPQQQIANGNGKKQKERKKLALFDRHVEKGENGKTSFKAFLASYRDVLNSKVYVGASIARILDVLAFKGYMVFLPKYLEHHYGIPQYRVHIFMAFFGVLGFACGALSGGIIMRKLRLNGRKAAIYVLAISVFNTGLFALKSTLGCHSIVSRVGQTGLSSEFNFTRQCNAECGCESAKLYPVCDASGNAFYSPCHAGYQLEFTECECVADGGMVSKELCTDNCDYMKYAFFATIVCGAFVAGTAMVPGMLLLLRSVPPQTRSPALGLQGLLVSLIGTLPSPILWGWLIDSACQVWDNDCRGQGACQIYDPWALRMRMHWLYVAVRLLSLVADVYVCLHAKGLNLQEEEETVTMEEVDKATTQETITLRAIPT